MRLFLAIFPPKTILDQIRDLMREFDKQKRNLKKVPIDQLHVTLRFIGPGVSEESRDQIIEVLRSVGTMEPIQINIEKLSFGFPYDHDPQILMLNVDSSDSLVELTDDMHQNIRSLQLRDTIRWKEKHANNFHITLARLKKTATSQNGKIMKELVKQLPPIEFEPFEAKEFFLVESVLTKDSSPMYRKLERFEV